MIAIATGTRADWGLLLPLADELRRRGADPGVIATYMHLLPGMGDTLGEIRADGYEPVALVATPREAAEATAAATSEFARELRRLRPDCMVILGDRFEMLGAATAALLCGVPLVHIAGGTVSEGAFDDSIRHAITKMATLHLCETELCRRRILQMGESEESVVVAGAPGVWNSINTPLMDRAALSESIGFDPGEEFLVATLHPATLDPMDPAEQMKAFTAGLTEAMERRPPLRTIATYPNTDTDPAPLVAELRRFEASMPGRVKVVESLGRVRYLSAVALSRAVVGNSSSGIVETPSLGKPTVNIGMRQNGRERGKAVADSPLETEAIAEAILQALSPARQAEAAAAPNPYFRPDTPSLMADAILALDTRRYPSKRFVERF